MSGRLNGGPPAVGIRAAAGLLAGAALVAVGGAGFHRVFELGSLAVPVLTAAAVPTALVGVCACVRRRVALFRSLGVSLALWLLVVVGVLYRGADGWPAAVFSALPTDLVDGCSRLLDSSLPAPPRPDLLLVPMTATWLAAAVTAELVVRTRAALLTALPAATLLLLALLLSASGPGTNSAVAVAFVLVAAGVLLARRSDDAAPPPGRPVRVSRAGLRAACCLVAVGLGAAAAGRVLPGARPYDPREHRALRSSVVGDENPLSRVAGWLATGDTPLFTVHSPARHDLTLAVLDRYDGREWTSSARFTAAGLRLPSAVGADRRHERVRQEITLQGLAGSLLPAVGQPVRFNGPAAGVDPTSGTLVSRGGAPVGLQYTVVSAPPPDLPADQLVALAPATGAAARRASTLPPGVPESLARAARRATAGALTPFQRVADLEHYFQTSLTNDRTAPPGVAYGNLRDVLTAGRGNSAQFGAAFAVAARALGLPARVVVGFLPGRKVVAGTYQVRSQDVLVWDEVQFAGVGWLPFFPAPRAVGDPADADDAFAVPGESRARAAAASAPGRATVVPGAAATPRPDRPATRGSADAFAPTAVLVLLLVGYLVAVGAVPVVRRHRWRTRGSPRQRVVGAWRETGRHWDPSGPAATNAERAAAGAAAAGGLPPPAAAPLVLLVDRALYAPAPPSDADAREAWACADQLTAAVRRGHPRRRRVASRLSVRVLTGRPGSVR